MAGPPLGLLTMPAEATATVSLYLDLEEGRRADLEAVARAALAFAGAIRETAYILDPSMTVRVELISGTDGSLSLNSLIRSLKVGDFITRKRLISLAITAVIWFTHETGRWTFDEVLRFFFATTPQQTEHLSKDDIDEIARRVSEIMQGRTGQQHVEQVYRELESDPAVTGVGATNRPGERPRSIVPRSDFPHRAGSHITTIETTELVKQTRRTHERVTLVRPVLQRGSRRWQFSGTVGSFGATIKDQRFLDDLLSGRLVVPMVEGIQMDIELDTTEERQGDVWIVTDREVVGVRNVLPPAIQQSLALTPPERPRPRPRRSNARNKDTR